MQASSPASLSLPKIWKLAVESNASVVQSMIYHVLLLLMNRGEEHRKYVPKTNQ